MTKPNQAIPIDAEELKRLREDAARYQFLRGGRLLLNGIYNECEGERLLLDGQELDEAVDAARAAIAAAQKVQS